MRTHGRRGGRKNLRGTGVVATSALASLVAVSGGVTGAARAQPAPWTNGFPPQLSPRPGPSEIAGEKMSLSESEHPDAVPIHLRPGFIIGFGGGNQYAGGGLQLAGLWPVRATRWSLSAGVGVGHKRYNDWEASQDKVVPHNGVAFTLGTSFGNKHRLCANIGYGPSNAASVRILGLTVDAVVMYGPFAGVGYEYISHEGLYFRILPLGYSRILGTLIPAEERGRRTFSAGVGWKVW